MQNDNNHTQDEPPANEGITEAAVQPTGELEQQQQIQHMPPSLMPSTSPMPPHAPLPAN